jgi:uncharacterized protein (DUF433 family)
MQRCWSWFIDSPSLTLAENGGNCAVAIISKTGFITGMKKKAVVTVDPEIMSGTPCFAGTRVPARTLLDYLEGGETLDEFLEQFPTVSRQQAVAFLEQAGERLLATA